MSAYTLEHILTPLLDCWGHTQVAAPVPPAIFPLNAPPRARGPLWLPTPSRAGPIRLQDCPFSSLLRGSQVAEVVRVASEMMKASTLCPVDQGHGALGVPAESSTAFWSYFLNS